MILLSRREKGPAVVSLVVVRLAIMLVWQLAHGKSFEPLLRFGLAVAVGGHFGIRCPEALGAGRPRSSMSCGRFCGHGHSSWLSFDEGNVMRSGLMSSGGLHGAFPPLLCQRLQYRV